MIQVRPGNSLWERLNGRMMLERGDRLIQLFLPRLMHFFFAVQVDTLFSAQVDILPILRGIVDEWHQSFKFQKFIIFLSPIFEVTKSSSSQEIARPLFILLSYVFFGDFLKIFLLLCSTLCPCSPLRPPF